MQPEMDTTLVLKIGYRGAQFAGFAAQPNTRTVAGELGRALKTFLRRPVELTCAGRTDTGVHALAQYVSLPVTAQEACINAGRIQRALNALTPDDISIRGVFRASKDFSARFEATSRHYIYRIVAGQARPVLSWDYAWWYRGALDPLAMNQAAQALVGEHDFVSFCKMESAQLLQQAGLSTCRDIQEVKVYRTQETGENLICVSVKGNAFLHNMVRIIVGTLAEVGRGHRDVSWVQKALAARDRKAAGPTAPARGLTFVDVTYPKGALLPWD